MNRVAKHCRAFKLFMVQFLVTISTAKDHCGEEQFWRSTECYFNPSRDDDTIFMPLLDKTFIRDDSIFFIETSCHGGVDYRQACAIESAARAHPRRPVLVLLVRALNATCLRVAPLAPLLHTHNNIELYKIDIHTYLQDTPLANFFKEGKFNRSKYPTTHLSDILRYATLYKFGGTYLDLDVILSKSFDLLPNKDNFMAKERDEIVGSAIFSLTRDGIGGVISDEIMSYLKHHYSPFEWSANSVLMMTSLIKKMCNTTIPVGCKGMHVYDRESFFPVSYRLRDEYYKVKEIPSRPYGFHVWNSATKERRYRNIGENTLLGRLMKQFCPISSENKLIPDPPWSSKFTLNQELLPSRWLSHGLVVGCISIGIYLVLRCTRKYISGRFRFN